MYKHLTVPRIIIFFAIFLLPFPAYAYLDPETGNALTYVIIGLFAVAVYFLRNLIYKVLGKLRSDKDITRYASKAHDDIIIFSEGPMYWYTFKPIIDAFLEKEINFSYYTMSKEDPALAIDNPYMASKYIGKRHKAFFYIMRKKATLMLATTPNIGTPRFPLPRPKNIQYLAHICHMCADISVYLKGSLDHYDAVLMVGDFMEKSIRTLEKLRGLKAKECLALGLPYLDELTSKIQKREQQNTPPVILIAPSWGKKSCIDAYGTQFIHDIAKANYKVIIRPHPHSWKTNKKALVALQKDMKSYANVHFDTTIDSTDSFHQADVLISDLSSIRFDFAFLYERPVISIQIPQKNKQSYEAGDLNFIWGDSVAKELGAVITPDATTNFVEIIEHVRTMPHKTLSALHKKYVMNIGCSGMAIAEWSVNKVKELKNKDIE